MKQAQNARKQRGRPSSRQGGKSAGSGNRSEQKIRGNPKQLVEKYKNQAREALQAGDRTQAEYFFQFADHYYRVSNEARNNASNQGDTDGQQNNSRRRRRGRQQADQQVDGNLSAGAAQNVNAGQEQSEQPGSSDRADRSGQPSKQPAKQQENPETLDADGKGGQNTVVAPVAAGNEADVAVQSQPVEVHPELALGDEAPKKPRRRTTSPRKKRAPADENVQGETAVGETAVAESDVA